MSDIRKWFMKQHGKANGSKPSAPASVSVNDEKQVAQENTTRRKTSKYFSETAPPAAAKGTASEKEKDTKKTTLAKRKSQKSNEEQHNDVKPSPPKRHRRDDDSDDDFVLPPGQKKTADVKPAKKLKRDPVDEEVDKDEPADEVVASPIKAAGRGKVGRGSGAAQAGRGRRGGSGGFMNFGERKEPPHKGEKEVPEGAPDCLAGLTFVISGTLHSLEREEAEDLIKRHGGRVTGSVSKKTNYLLAEEDVGGRKSMQAKELGTAFLTEDGLFYMIRKSKTAKEPQVSPMEESIEEDTKPLVKSSPVKNKATGTAQEGRGKGAGRGGFMNFAERKDPPHKGEKEVPEGVPDCLAGLTFVISGTLDSLEREEAEDLIKRHGGRVTGSVSKKTNYLLADEDIGGRKSMKAKELGTSFLTEDGLFDMIRKSKPAKEVQVALKKASIEKVEKALVKNSPVKVETRDAQGGSVDKRGAARCSQSKSPLKQNGKAGAHSSLTWTEKYRPKVPNDIIGNQSLVKQLHEWLHHWDKHFLHAGLKKGKKQNDSTLKKAVLISGSPGIGKSTSAKLVSKMLGFEVIEVNASDNRGKADSKISKGISGSTSNSIKELVNNTSMSYSKDGSKHLKSVLIMDEVDGMSAGDRGGVADLIASIKISKIPIICICNDRYSQKLKSLVNYCMLLNFRKPTKQQMAKRLKQIADAEGLQVNEVALEELADRVNGDMRMALNQLQYMSLSMALIKYDDIRARLLSSWKDEDISPFTAVDKLFGFNGGKLRMDERIDLSMSDPDLVPLIVQENYINYRPTTIGKDDNGVKRMNLIARAAESIGDGDIFNVQIRRYRQWQLSQAGSFASCIIPAALMHGNRETLEPGERNFNRFGGWLGKNSTMGKNLRLLEDVHVHVLSSQESNLNRDTLRVENFSLLLKQLTDPLRVLPKEDAVQKVVQLMDAYSLNQEDFDTVVELSKFQGRPNPMDGIQPAVKAALTKAYKLGGSNRVVRAADLVPLPGVKKAPKKRIAAMLEPEPLDGALTGDGDALAENEESSDTEDTEDGITDTTKPVLDLQTDKSKGVQVQLDLKDNEKPKSKAASASKSRGSDSTGKAGRGSGGGGKRKR